MLANHAVNFSGHVLCGIDFTLLVARDNDRDLWVKREAEDLRLVEQLLAAMSVRLHFSDKFL